MKLRAKHLLRCGVCVIALASVPVHAAKVMDIQAEDMLRAVGHVKDTLALSPNQQILWQQVASKSGALLRQRQSRREKLQADLKSRLTDPRQELRDLAGGIELEATTSAAEDRELRELWLTVADALNDQQRQLAVQFMANQLERVDTPERGAGTAPGRSDGPANGHRRQKPEGGAGGHSRF